jgi:hypothetical protein
VIRLRVLGPVALHDSSGSEISAVLAQPKRLALLAYLAADQAGAFRRGDTPLGLFWPELDYTPRCAQESYQIGRLFARAGRSDLARATLTRYAAVSDTGWRRKEEFFAHRLRVGASGERRAPAY